MKINLNIKTIISMGVILISSGFGILLYTGFTNFYKDNIGKKFIDENLYTSTVAVNFLEKEKEILMIAVRQIVDSPKTVFAYKRNEYVSVNISIEKDNPYKLSEINRFLYKKLAGDLKKELLSDNGGQEGKTRRDIVLYDKNGEILADTGIKKGWSSYEKYIKDILGAGREGFSTSIFEFTEDDLTMKALSGITWPGGEGTYGIVEVKKNIDGMMLDEMKKTTNREIIVVKGEKIVGTTIFDGERRVVGGDVKISPDKKENFYLMKVNRRDLGFSFQPIYNYNKQIIGYIGTGFHYDEVEKVLAEGIRKFAFYSIILTISLVGFLFLLFSVLTSPFGKIIEGIRNIAKGEYVKIEEFYGIKELKLLAESTNKMSMAIKQREYEIDLARRTLAHMNEELDYEIMTKTKSIRNILNNAGQGFMTFGKNQIIDEEYSAECTKIFGEKVGKKLFYNLIKSQDEEEKAFITRIIGNIIEEEDEDQREVYISLLPEKLEINDKYIELEYKYISEENKIMAIVTDNTEQREMAVRMEKEKNNLKMLVKAASYNVEVRMILKEFIGFYKKKIFKIESVEELNREIHTFKGNFAQFNFVNTANKLGLLEQEIHDLCKTEQNKSDILKKIFEYNFEAITKDDIKIINKYFGEEFITKDDIVEIKEEVLIRLEEKMHTILAPGELNMLLPEVLKMRYKSLKDILKNYPEYTINLAQTFGKEIEMFKVEGADILVDAKKYREFSKSLIHIFRNIADHGIETPEIRLRAGKKTTGKISIVLNKVAEKIILSISDDGAGIDIERIKDRILEKEIYTQSELEKMSTEEINNVIFLDNFTTKNDVSDISGRGVGLSALKKEVKNLDGEIKVISQKGRGTTFLITLPYIEADKSIEVSGGNILNSFISGFGEYFAAGTDIRILSQKNPAMIEYDELEKYSTTINIKGSLHGDVLFSADEELSQKLTEYFIDRGEKNEFSSQDVLEAITEILNIVIGNCSQSLLDCHKIIMTYFDVSEIREGDNMKIIKSRFDMWGSEIVTSYGKMSLVFIEKGNRHKGDEELEGSELEYEKFTIAIEDDILGKEIDLDEFDIETVV